MTSQSDCSVHGCVRRVFSGGLCARHYEEKRLENAPPCSIDGCERKAERKGMCNMHYRQHRLAANPPCTVEGCGRPQFVGGLCQTHHKRVQRYGSLDADKRAVDSGLRREHPLYETWRWHSRHGTLCDAWKDFWSMVEAVGERPSPAHRLLRHDNEKPIGPGNWRWHETIERPDHASRQREWRRRNPDRTKNYHMRRSFGITLDDYNAMAEAQGHVCAICGRPETSKGQNGTAQDLAVDHCHDGGKIRGLLCSFCNRGLGFFEDDIDRIKSAIRYVRKHKR